MQLAIMMSHGPDGINVGCLPDAWKVSSMEPLWSLRDCQSIIGVALGQNQQLFSGCLCDVDSGLDNRNRQFSTEPLNQSLPHDAHESGISG